MTLISRKFILLEILFFVVFALGTKAIALQWTPKYAGPITLILTLLILTQYMRLNGKSWAQYGLKQLVGVKPKLMVIPQALLVFIGFIIAVGSVLVLANVFQITVLLEVSDGVEARFGEVRGNLPKLFMWLGIVWVSAAFGEEMFFRGYLVTRLKEALPSSVLATIVAVLIPALIFGYGHYHYQGIRGFIMTGLIGLAFGISYLLLKRNLWPIILVHGVVDTLGFIGQYLGVE
ncbi:MAG: CPBP family intramembrane metalloprotease [Alteromonadaceae bacterium]|nr:CPBP family intramembrane metalloprotease [Alteromonadaceae bacterium]